MKIAIATDDQKTIRKGYFANSRYFLVLEILNAAVAAREWRKNLDSAESKTDAQDVQPQQIIKLLGDCSIMVGRICKETSLQEISSWGIDLLFSEIEEINQALSSYLDGKVEGFQYYDKEAKALIPCSERSFSKA